MSLITRCTACGTTFKVVPDLLKISQGWARCGNCGEVFDASAQLLGDAVVANGTTVTHPASITSPVEPPAQVHQASFQDEPAYRQPVQQEPPRMDDWAHHPDPDPPFVAIENPEPVFDDANDLPTDSVSEASTETIVETVAPELELEPEVSTLAEPESHEDVSFVKQARRREFWRKPGVRVALVFAALLLLIAGAMQFAILERDRIVAMEPRSRPIVQAICDQIGCKISPLKQIDSFVVDSSTFAAAGPNLYRLSIGLRNNSTIMLAMPSIELTLTNSQDQTVVRRVLQPSELGAPETLSARSDWSGAISVSVSGAEGARITGYRVLAFYP